jgi:ribonuclease HI
MTHATMAFDGGVRGGNPGHAGFAAVITLAGKDYVIARPLKGRNTNNVAEYMGLIVGSKYAHHLGVEKLDIFSDSKLVVEQVNGNWRIDSPTMCKLCWEATGSPRAALPRPLDSGVGSAPSEHHRRCRLRQGRAVCNEPLASQPTGPICKATWQISPRGRMRVPTCACAYGRACVGNSNTIATTTVIQQ